MNSNQQILMLFFGGIPISLVYSLFVIKMNDVYPKTVFDMGPYSPVVDFRKEMDGLPALWVTSIFPVFGTWMAVSIFTCALLSLVLGEKSERF